MRWRIRLAVVLCLALCLSLAACSMLPESGRVHRDRVAAPAPRAEAPYVVPPGPVPGGTPSDIVRGFLVAMQANPFSTASARDFLASRPRASWRPDNGTVVYSGVDVSGHPTSRDTAVVTVRMTGTHRLDSRGVWSAGPATSRTVRLSLTRQHGQWRITDPRGQMLVRTAYYESQFEPYDVYFFNSAGRVLVPEPVHLPHGRQTATSLVRTLLAGPGPRLAGGVRSAFPASASLDLSVVVKRSGIADVPLGPEVLKLSPAQLNEAAAQLAWTLHQVPGVTGIEITVGGTPVALPDGHTVVTPGDDAEFSPTGTGPAQELVGISNGRVVTLSGGRASSVAGPLGRPGFVLRSVAQGRNGTALAAVSQSGTTAFLASLTGSYRVQPVLTSAHDLMPPVFDLHGELWLVDRTAHGAVVHVIRGTRDKVVHVQGISGSRLSAFSVSPDGSRLVAAVRRGRGRRKHSAVVVDLVGRTQAGGVERGVHPLVVPSLGGPHRVLSVGWRTPTVLVALTRRKGTSRIAYAAADGSPGHATSAVPDPYEGAATALAVDAGGGPVVLLDRDGSVARLDAAGKWVTPRWRPAERFKAIRYAG